MQTIVRGDTWEHNIRIPANENKYPIRSTTDTDPIVLTTVQATPAVTGDWWNISGHEGNTGVATNNGNFQITKTDPYTMSLDDSEGNGAGGVSGFIQACADCTVVDIDTDVTGYVKQYASAETIIATFTKEWIQQVAGLLKISLTEANTLAVPVGTYRASVVVTFPDNTTTVWEEVLIFVDAPTTPIPD